MAMQTASQYMTPCEVLRQINDLCQGNDEKDKKIRELVAKFEIMAKRLAHEVNNRPGSKISDSWWEKTNIDWKNIFKFRISDLYKYG